MVTGGRCAVQGFSSGTHLRTVRRSICWRSVPQVWTSQAGAEFRAARCEKGILPSGQRDARHSKSWACSPPICVPERKNKTAAEAGCSVFHLIFAEVTEAFRALCGQQTDAAGWFDAADMGSLPLDPGISRWLAGRG
jgi:hypothetical protein